MRRTVIEEFDSGRILPDDTRTELAKPAQTPARYRTPPTLRQWYVRDTNAVEHFIVAHYCFNNGEEGLLFRRHTNDDINNRTEVVASFAQGFWQFYKDANSDGWKHT